MEVSTSPRSIASRTVVLTLVLVFGAAAMAAAQGVSVSGRLYHSVSSKPIAGATVAIEGTSLEVTSGPDGSYSIPNVPAGPHHLIVTAKGFVPARSELTVAQTAVILDVAIDPELHYSEVVSVGPDARNQFDSYQPTTVLAGQDLAKQLGGTVGATLATQPGVAERSFGPGPSRPVIRGLDGDRVLILDDGQRIGDLSSQSGDHGVVVNPTGAARIEVVRGPATLLYGVERHRRSRQRDFRHDPNNTRQRREWRADGRSGIRGLRGGRRRRRAVWKQHVGSARLRAAAAVPAMSTRRTARSGTVSHAGASDRSAWRGPGSVATLAGATATTTPSTACRTSKKDSSS